MGWRHAIDELGCWEGYLAKKVSREEGECWIELVPVADVGRCSGCGREDCSIHDWSERWIRDLPAFELPVSLLVHRRRVLCAACGPKLEGLSWLAPHARQTRRLQEAVARLADTTTVKLAADHFGLDRKTAKRLHKEYLRERLGPLIPPDDVEVLAMDEFAIQRGHRYATVVVDPRTRRVLWVGRGRSREAIAPFFDWLGPERCTQVRAVAMDMNSAYEVEVLARCPHAEVVFDLFHVVAKYGREVIDRVRVDEANRLRDDKPARKVVKSARWLLLRNRKNLKGRSERIRLKELLDANRRLCTVYVLKDDLKHLWDFRYEGAARKFWKRWYSRAVRSRIEPLKRFAQKLKGYIDGIFSHCRFPLHTSLLEGINNRIKVIKRLAYGYRDDEYFFLRIRAAFPGNGS